MPSWASKEVRKSCVMIFIIIFKDRGIYMFDLTKLSDHELIEKLDNLKVLGAKKPDTLNLTT